ncbi:MAG: prolyl oligopeptidase family serine peptidase, partial [Gammaproteobacteria bacterium]|nr:prolyl oligopeptidase family serine peptidase [Gammaproteobacteria bacterium]
DFTTREDRPLTLEVWYPADNGTTSIPATYADLTRSKQRFELQGVAWRDAEPLKGETTFPLVVLSHGYTGSRSIMFYLAEHLASHGYVVVGIDHTDSTNAEVDFFKAPYSGFTSTLFHRARDQQFVLDYFSTQETPFANLVDTDNAAVIGYSMGGYGALNTAGGCYQYTEASLLQFGFTPEQAAQLMPVFNYCNAGQEKTDTRWKAVITYSAWGGEQDVHDSEALSNLPIPSLYLVGDADDISGYSTGVKKLHQQTATKQQDVPSYLLVYMNARHNIAAHPAPKVAYNNELDLGHYFEPSWNVEILNRINKHTNLAFLNCYVKNQATACDYLPQREDITQYRQEDGTLSDPWPGFQPRWGTGVKFYRQ